MLRPRRCALTARGSPSGDCPDSIRRWWIRHLPSPAEPRACRGYRTPMPLPVLTKEQGAAGCGTHSNGSTVWRRCTPATGCGTSRAAGGAISPKARRCTGPCPTRRWIAVGSPSMGSEDRAAWEAQRSEEHTSELQSLAYLVCRLLLEKNKKTAHILSPLTFQP